MKEDRYDNIEYNDSWESVPVVRAEPVQEYEEDAEDVEEDFRENEDSGHQKGTYTEFFKERRSAQNPQPVIKLQFLLAIIAVAAAFILKSLGGDIYASVNKWYFDNLNNSLIVTLSDITKGDDFTEAPTEKATLQEEKTQQKPTAQLQAEEAGQKSQNPTETQSTEALTHASAAPTEATTREEQ